MIVSLVKKERPKTVVTVGLRFEEDTSCRDRAKHTTAFEQPPSLQADPECKKRFKTERKHILSCLGSAYAGVLKTQTDCHNSNKCLITILKGTHLQIDSGVGFAVAAQIASARELGVELKIDSEKMYGWIERT
jgi:hypothetical protein